MSDTIPPVRNCAPYPQIVPTIVELFTGRDEWWLWYAIDADGSGHYFEREPFVEGESWGWDGGSIFGYKHDMTGANWQTCVWARPIEVEIIEPTEDDKRMFTAFEMITRDIAAYVSKQAKLSPHN